MPVRHDPDLREGRQPVPSTVSLHGRAAPSGALPRRLSDQLLWTGRCLNFEYQGKTIHSHISAFVVKGSEKTVMIDTGAPASWSGIEQDVEEFLRGRPLDYVFPTHPEFPHGGSLPALLAKYPDAVAVGDLRDHAVYYPNLTDRFRSVKAGDELDLGDRKLVFVPALWRDLPTTLWAFETTARVLFVSDAFSFLHHHEVGNCDRLTSEQPPIDIALAQYFNERALSWTRFTDIRESIGELDRLIAMLKPAMIASSHGSPFDTLERIADIKTGMSVYQP